MHALFTLHTPLILASASPRRQQFLQELGLPYTVCRPHGVEPTPQTGEAPADYALRAAHAKADAVRAQLGDGARNHIILAADTVVAVGHTLLGKPHDDADALRMLQLLCGRRHTVITAVSLHMPHGEELFYDATDVQFYPWDDPTLRAYVRTGEPADKAGAYAIQGQGAFLVQRISGSWATVVGLPVGLVVEMLRRHRCISPTQV